MSCPVLVSLSSAVAAVRGLPLPEPGSLGAAGVLAPQVAGLAAAVAGLHADLALRMAALERAGSPTTDVRGEAVRAGVAEAQATLLRQLGRYAADHPQVRQAWLAGTITADQVNALRSGSVRLATPALRQELVDLVLPQLPPLDARRSRQLVAWAVDRLQPGDPDGKELSDHAARYLDYSDVPRGGITFAGYLPPADAAAFTAAIEALASSLRVRGDGVTPAQRRADALTALVAVAARHGLPDGGGTPAAVTMTVSVSEAARVALRDPAAFGTRYEARPHGGATIDGEPVGDAAVRFGICSAAITPILVDQPEPGSLLARIAGTGTLPLAVGRAVRLATPAQRKALRIRDGGCAIPGCTTPAPYTEPHHVTPYSLNGPTDLDNLVSLCWVHHRLTELGRFTFLRRRPGDQPPPGALQHSLYWILPPAA